MKTFTNVSSQITIDKKFNVTESNTASFPVGTKVSKAQLKACGWKSTEKRAKSIKVSTSGSLAQFTRQGDN